MAEKKQLLQMFAESCHSWNDNRLSGDCFQETFLIHYPRFSKYLSLVRFTRSNRQSLWWAEYIYSVRMTKSLRELRFGVEWSFLLERVICLEKEINRSRNS